MNRLISVEIFFLFQSSGLREQWLLVVDSLKTDRFAVSFAKNATFRVFEQLPK